MPFPMIVIGAAVAVGAAGVGAGVKGAMDQSEANKTNERAQNIVDNATSRINRARKQTGHALEKLGETKIEILNHSIKDFIDTFSKLKNVEFEHSRGLNELGKLRLDKKSFEELREMQSMASSIAGGAVGGSVIGAATAFGAYGGAMMFGAASTGTAIASLSGAAATNATLAFFGGGSLAAGGLGVAGGTAVLGGIVAAPALAVLGVVMAAKGSANKDKAYSNLAQAKDFAAEMDVAATMCDGITKRARMFSSVLEKLDGLFTPMVNEMAATIKRKGDDFKYFYPAEKQNIAACCSMAQAIKAILDTPILDEDGKLTDRSARVIERAEQELKELSA